MPSRLLPPAPTKYSQENEDQTRRLIEQMVRASNASSSGATPNLANIPGYTNSAYLRTANDRGVRWQPSEFLRPEDFGQMSDADAFDCEPAIQAALDQAFINMHAGYNGTTSIPGLDARTDVRLPQAGATLGFQVSKPVWIKGGCGLVGAGSGYNYFHARSCLTPTFASGYTVVATQGFDMIQNHLAPGHFGVTTPSYHHASLWSQLGFDDLNAYPAPDKDFIDFRETNHFLDLHGLSQFSVEFTYKPDAYAVDYSPMLVSLGRWKISEYTTQGCFSIYANNDSIVATITTSNGTFSTTTVGGHGIMTGGVEHAICMDYDGTHLRVFIGDIAGWVKIGEVAATGTLVQHDAEGVTFGRTFTHMPYRAALASSPTGEYGTFRFSNISRRTASVPFGGIGGFDANVLLEINWSNIKGPMVGGSTNDGIAWHLRRCPSPPTSPAAVGTSGDGFAIETTGLCIKGICLQMRPFTAGGSQAATSGFYIAPSGAVRGRFEDLSVLSGARVGLCTGDYTTNVYGSIWSHIYIAAWNGRFAWQGGGSSDGISVFDNLYLAGGLIVMSTAWGKTLRDCFFEMNSAPSARADGGKGTAYGLMFTGGDIGNVLTLIGTGFTCEGGGSDVLAQILINDGGFGSCAVNLYGTKLEQFYGLSNNFPVQALPIPASQPGILICRDDESTHSPPPGKLGPNYAGGVQIISDGLGFNGFDIPYGIRELIAVEGPIGDNWTPNVILRNPQFWGALPAALSTTPGAASAEAVGVREVAFQVGANPVVDTKVTKTSADNSSDETLSINVGAGVNGILLARVSYIYTGVKLLQMFCGVSPFNVTTYPLNPLVRWPEQPNIGDAVTEVWATQDHPASSTVDFEFKMQGPVGVGYKFGMDIISIFNVPPGDPLEKFAIWKTQATGSHTIHKTVYETRRPNSMVVDWIAGSAGAAPTPDAGQTSQVSVDTGSHVAFGLSTKAEASPIAATDGWTLVSSSVPSSHISVILRPTVPTFDALRGNLFHLKLTGNVSQSQLVYMYPGMKITLVIEQDATGGRTFSFPSNIAGTAPTINAAASAKTVVKIVHDGTGPVFA